MTASFLHLPEALRTCIFSQITDARDKASAGGVCRSWRVSLGSEAAWSQGLMIPSGVNLAKAAQWLQRTLPWVQRLQWTAPFSSAEQLLPYAGLLHHLDWVAVPEEGTQHCNASAELYPHVYTKQFCSLRIHGKLFWNGLAVDELELSSAEGEAGLHSPASVHSISLAAWLEWREDAAAPCLLAMERLSKLRLSDTAVAGLYCIKVWPELLQRPGSVEVLRCRGSMSGLGAEGMRASACWAQRLHLADCSIPLTHAAYGRSLLQSLGPDLANLESLHWRLYRDFWKRVFPNHVPAAHLDLAFLQHSPHLARLRVSVGNADMAEMDKPEADLLQLSGLGGLAALHTLEVEACAPNSPARLQISLQDIPCSVRVLVLRGHDVLITGPGTAEGSPAGEPSSAFSHPQLERILIRNARPTEALRALLRHLAGNPDSKVDIQMLPGQQGQRVSITL